MKGNNIDTNQSVLIGHGIIEAIGNQLSLPLSDCDVINALYNEGIKKSI
jgi:hypothetical protein